MISNECEARNLVRCAVERARINYSRIRAEQGASGVDVWVYFRDPCFRVGVRVDEESLGQDTDSLEKNIATMIKENLQGGNDA